MSIVQCYAPTENADLDEKEAFYSLLDKTLIGIKRSDITVMMGDFNAQVGNNNQNIEHTRVLQKVSALHFLKNLYLCYRYENNVTFQYNLPSSKYI